MITNVFVEFSYGVLRGLHYQEGDTSQAKLVRVIKGNLEFEPFESGILTPLYYGLSSFNFTIS